MTPEAIALAFQTAFEAGFMVALPVFGAIFGIRAILSLIR